MEIIGKGKAGGWFGGGIASHGIVSERGKPGGRYKVVCRNRNGEIQWVDYIENLIPNVALSYLLGVALDGASQITSWYLGLTDGTPTPAAADTMASHAGWAEVEEIDETHRPAWQSDGEANQQVSNSHIPAQLTISHDGTILGGAFLSSSDEVGGTAGTLYSVGAFQGGDKTIGDGDTIDVTAQFTMADDGA